MGASTNQQKSKFDQSGFKRDVMEYYETTHGPYCHLTGWHYFKAVKAAHPVPKSLTSSVWESSFWQTLATVRSI